MLLVRRGPARSVVPVAVLAGAVLAGALTACGATRQQTAPAARTTGPTSTASTMAPATRTLAAPSPLGVAVPVAEAALGSGSVTVLSENTHTTGAGPGDPAPARGTYLVVDVRVTGGPLLSTPNAWAVFVGTPGPLGVETLEGNAPASGWVPAARQLPTTRLAAGQSVEGEIVFDVAGPHGLLAYDEGGAAERTWRF